MVYTLRFFSSKCSLFHYSKIFGSCIIQILYTRCAKINPLTPDDQYSGRTAPLTSKRYILYIYSTNIGTEYFKHGIYSSFFSLQNAVYFIILTYLVPVLFTLYIQGVLKLKKNNSGVKSLISFVEKIPAVPELKHTNDRTVRHTDMSRLQDCTLCK